jgi:hypothetical protein
MRPFQTWDCGDATCPIKSSEGKRLERVIVWSLESLGTLNRLIKNSTDALSVACVNADHKNTLRELIDALEKAQKNPYDQSLHERVWEIGEDAVNALPTEDKLVLLPWIPPFSNTIPEMAFCRVVDGWKDYVEKHTGVPYGQHRSRLSVVHECCDDCLNSLRNLFVHGTGFLEMDDRGVRRYAKFTRLAKDAASHSSSTNPILKIPSRVCAVLDGDIVMLNILEVCQYIEGLKELFFSLE